MVCPGAAGLFDQPGTAAAAQQCWPHTGPPPRSKPGGGSVARCGGAQLQGGTACAAPPPALHCQGSAEAALQASRLGTAPSADAMPGRACELRPHSILSSSLPEHLPHSGVKSRLLPRKSCISRWLSGQAQTVCCQGFICRSWLRLGQWYANVAASVAWRASGGR